MLRNPGMSATTPIRPVILTATLNRAQAEALRDELKRLYRWHRDGEIDDLGYVRADTIAGIENIYGALCEQLDRRVG